MNFSSLDKALQGLFKPLGTVPGAVNSPYYSAKRGSLITFNYSFWMNDAYPLVVVTDINPGNRIRGVNLHYLTFPYIKNLLERSCTTTGGISYANIKSDQYIVDAFRSYKWNGVRQMRVLDCEFVLKVMNMVRSIDPTQVQIIRQVVRDQIKKQVNPTADQLNSNQNTFPSNSSTGVSNSISTNQQSWQS